MKASRRTARPFSASVLGVLALIALPAAVVLAGAPSAYGDIVFSTGAPGLGSSIYAMNDDGSNVRVLASGDYQKPFVAADGTVVFSNAYSVLFPSGSVYAYKDGATRTLASDFPGAADDVEAGYNGRYAFKNVIKYATDVLREGNLSSGSTSPLDLCHRTYPFESDEDHFGLAGYWAAETDEPQEPAVNPVREQLVFSGCTWRRHWSDETEAIEAVPALLSLTPGGGEQWLLKGEDNWSIDDASFSPDGNSLVLVYWRGYDAGSEKSPGFERQTPEGIYVSDAEGNKPRQVLSLGGGRRQNVLSPRFTGDGRIVFGFTDWIEFQRDGIYSVPASCNECTLANATLLHAGGTYAAWTPLHIAAPASSAGGVPATPIAGQAPAPPAPASAGSAPQRDAATFTLPKGARAKTATVSRSGSFTVGGVKVACAAGAGSCSVTATASTSVPFSFKAALVSAKKKTKSLTLATRSFKLPAGKSSTLTLKLSRKGLSALRRLRAAKIAIKITVTKPGTRTVIRTVTVTLRAPR